MKKLLTICLLIATSIATNAQEKNAVDSLDHYKQFYLGESFEKYKNEISKFKDTDYYEYKTNDVLIAFGETVETVYLKFNKKNTGKLIEIFLVYKQISTKDQELIKKQYVQINNELTQKLGVNYKKDEEKPGAVTWKGKKIQLSYELNKYVNEKELIINGNYEVLALYSSIKITLL
jgi:hypothetical protein